MPGTWLVLLPVLAFILKHTGKKKSSAVLWSVEILLVLGIGFYPVGEWLVIPLEKHYSELPDAGRTPDGIIVLGGAWQKQPSEYWGQLEMNGAAERDIYMAMLAREYPQARLVFTGGNNRVSGEGLAEADIAQEFYQRLGVQPGRMVFESKSRNTYENGLFSQRLVQPQASEEWWLITSAYHMPRARGVFCKLGWNVVPYPVDHFYWGGRLTPHWAFAYHLSDLEHALHEWVGLLVYRVTGKTMSLFPESDCS